MKKIPRKLVRQQYENPSNLDARCYFNKRFGVKKNKHGWYEYIFKHFDFPDDAKILELGCGMGNLWTSNNKRIKKEWDITLSDFSRQMLKETKNNVKDMKHKFNFKVIDADNIPYNDETFDAVIANHLLYLVPNVKKTLKEISRAINPGGILIASTSGKNYMKELEDLLRKSKLPVHLNYAKYSFSLENGIKLLQNNFNKIKLYKSKGIFHVTEAVPMANYVLSTNTNLSKKQKQEVYDFFDKYFSKNKKLIITRETGIFVAKKKL